MVKGSRLPKISIVVPSFNKAEFIEATLQSIIDQNYPNLEVIIQDGGSTDGTLEIIKKFAKKYPRIFKWISKKDKGQVDAINKGIKKATGDILAYINADDVYTKGVLLRVGKYFRIKPQTLWLTGYGDIIDENGRKISPWVTMYKNYLINLNSYASLLAVNFITQPSTFLSRKAFKEYGPFTGTKKYVMEYDFWLKLGRVEKPQVIREYLSSFRLTRNNISATSFKELLSLDYQIAKKYTNNPLLLWLHKFHNWGRVSLITIFK